jgi:hypothetical protein
MKVDKQNDDLITLIEQEKQSFDKFDQINSLKFYCYYISKIFIETYIKLKELENIDVNEGIILGSNMIHHIFWVLISYTFNLQPTVFLVDRAILLYIQFIVMSRNPEMNTDQCYMPNINDAITFTYRKSIGPISVANIETHTELENIRNSSYLVKMIIQNIFLFLINPNEKKKRENMEENYEKIYLNKAIDSILNFLTNIIYQIHLQKINDHTHIYNLILPLFCDLTPNNLIYNIYLSKLLLIQIYNFYQNETYIKENIKENVKYTSIIDNMKTYNNFIYEYTPDFPVLEIPSELTNTFKKYWDMIT